MEDVYMGSRVNFRTDGREYVMRFMQNNVGRLFAVVSDGKTERRFCLDFSDTVAGFLKWLREDGLGASEVTA